MHCLYGRYNLHRFSDALGLVNNVIKICINSSVIQVLYVFVAMVLFLTDMF